MPTRHGRAHPRVGPTNVSGDAQHRSEITFAAESNASRALRRPARETNYVNRSSRRNR